MIIYIKNASELDTLIKSNEKVIIDFYADWCGPCQMLAPFLEEISDEHNEIAIIKINADKFPDLCMKYAISSIPALFSYINGEKYKTQIGYVGKDEILNLVK